MSGPVLVTGGTGTLGRHVVRRLVEAGNEVRVLSRRQRPSGAGSGGVDAGSGAVTWCVGDLGTGTGIDAALVGTSTIIHCASDPRRAAADIEATRRLVTGARAADVGHLVYISIVGIDRIPLTYYRTKLAVERLIEQQARGSGLGATILRATQFHDLVLALVAAVTRAPLAPALAGISVQPVEADEVAQRLVQLAAGAPAGRVSDMGGPEIRSTTDLIRTYLHLRGKRRLVVPVRIPGQIAGALRSGANLTPDHADGVRTWEDFLRTQP